MSEQSQTEEVKAEEAAKNEQAQNTESATNEAQENVTPINKEEDTFKQKFFYLAAEFENTKKRFEREKESIVKYGSEKILSGLLDVLDNLDRTVDAIRNDEDKKVKNIFIGIDMVKTQFAEVLKQNGLSEVEAVGKEFDPNFHEALTQESVDGKKENEVTKVFQKGYILNGRLIRPAKVVINKINQ